MRAGAAPQLVESTAATVTIGDIAVPATAWSMRRSLGELGQPAVRAATGSVTLTRSEGVVSRRHGSPWRGSITTPRETVTIDAGAGPFRVFTGVVDGVDGSAGSGVSVDLVDHFSALNQPVNIPGLLRAMPPHAPGGPIRHIGLMAEYVADYAMRRCGFYATPWRTVDTILDAPLQTSAWPHIGTCTRAGTRVDLGFSQATYRPTPDGFFGAENLDATYLTTSPADVAGPLHIMAAIGQGHTGFGRVFMPFTGGNLVLEVTATHVIAKFNGVHVVSVPATPDTYTACGLAIRDGVVTVRTNGGHTGSAADPGTLTGTSSTVNVWADQGSRLAGAQVGTPADATFDLYPVRQWVQSAVLRSWNNIIYLDATPDVAQRPAIDVLTEIARAQCIYLWLDEDGKLHFEHADAIRARPAVVTLTAKDSLLELAHHQGTDTSGVNVHVSAQTPVVNRSTVPNILLWQGRTTGLDSEQVLEEVINRGDEVWVGVDQEFDGPYIDGGGGRLTAAAARGRGSLTGGIVTEDGQPDILVEGGTNAKSFLSHPLPGVWRLRVEAGPLTSTQTLSMKIADLDIVSAAYRDTNLPVVRGMGKASWSTTSHAAATNIPGRDGIEHDGGRWLQDSEAGSSGAQVIGDFLGALLSADRTTLSVRVVPDFRVQLADVVTVTDPVWLGVSVTGVVTDISVSGSDREQSMRLGIDVLSAEATDTTLAEFDARWAGKDLAAHDARWSGKSLAALDADPLA